MKTIVHVNQHIIKSNLKGGVLRPPLTVKTYKGALKAYEVEIAGPSKVVYSPDKPLNCGAKVWIETQSKVTSFDMCRYCGDLFKIPKPTKSFGSGNPGYCSMACENPIFNAY